MQLPLIVSCRPSPRVGAFYFLLHLLALIALAAATVSPWLAGAGALGVMVSALRCARAWRSGRGQLRLGARGALDVQLGEATAWQPGRIRQSLRWPWLVAISMAVDTDPPMRWSVTLLKGDLDEQTWRRILVWLRWSVPGATPTP